MKKVKGLILRPSEQLEEIEIEDSLDGIYKAINCDIFQVAVIGTDSKGNQWQMLLDEEGKIHGKQYYNTSLTPFGLIGDIAVGPMLFLGLTDDGENCDLAPESADQIHNILWSRSPRSQNDENTTSFVVEKFGKEV